MTGFPREDYRALEPYAPDRRPVRTDLSDNTNLWGPHPAALELLRSPPREGLSRYPSVYADALRAAVARAHGVPEACVTTGCGSDDLLDSTFRALGTRDGRVSFPDPTFSMIPIFARVNGMEAVAVDDAEADRDPRRLLEPEPDAVYLCRPNNPTGRLLPEAWIQELLDAGGPDGPVVVLDEAYAEFAGETRIRQAPATSRLLVLRTLSKAYGLAGLRVGFGVGPREVVDEVEKSRGPYKVGRLDEMAAVRALDDPAGWVDEVVEKTVANRSRLAGELAARGFAPLPSRANFLLVPVDEHGAADLTARLRELGVAVRPFPDLRGTGDAVRITIGPWELMDRFLQALDAVLEDRAAESGEDGAADPGGPAGDGGSR